MELMHNQTFRLLEDATPGAYPEGLYRVICADKYKGQTVVVKIDQSATTKESRGGRKKIDNPKWPNKKSPLSLVGELQWFDDHELQRAERARNLQEIEIEREAVYNKPIKREKEKSLYDIRVSVMGDFLNPELLIDSILANGGLGPLVRETMEKYGVSRTYIYKLWSILCRLGIVELSLRGRHDRCGAPGRIRPCDPGGRKKAGRKTAVQRAARDRGIDLPPKQPGMSTEWRARIMAADKRIKMAVKPRMPARYIAILDSHFVKKFRNVNGQMVAIDPAQGEYPTYQQVKRVLEVDIPRLQRLRESTTSGHFNRAMRGLTARAWKNVAGPGHTWAIDSTVGDIYLRSSVNRAWIVGRPIVYIIVDVWSTAIVGFYVCLTGPSWDTARISLFNAMAPSELVGGLMGFEYIQTLYPAPTMCFKLMCDRGEYLSKAASITAFKLIPCMSYAPPYRPDLKGLVEVLHRIAKDAQFQFTPGSMDARRAEYDLRKSHPEESVLTVQEYTEYLHIIFSEYNLTADRSKRVDAHMAAAGVFPSPAGLWRWGHEMGIGNQRFMLQSDLITTLLDPGMARIGISSVMFGGNDYQSSVVKAEEWTTHVRNFGGKDLPIFRHPGAVKKIWTPNSSGEGLLDLHITDQSRASPELTFDELIDSYAFTQLQRGDVAHEKAMLKLQAFRRRHDIKVKAEQLTAEALAKAKGTQPTMTDARHMEAAVGSTAAPETSELRATESNRDEAAAAHFDMMNSILSSMNGEGESS